MNIKSKVKERKSNGSELDSSTSAKPMLGQLRKSLSVTLCGIYTICLVARERESVRMVQY